MNLKVRIVVKFQQPQLTSLFGIFGIIMKDEMHFRSNAS